MHIKKILILFLLVSIIALHQPPIASAHFLETDNNIGAVLHVDPNDDPIAKSPAAFFFAFKDKQNKFQPKNCDCTFLIYEHGNEIFSQPLFANNDTPSLSNASIFYTFPKIDVYEVVVTGEPFTKGSFQPFTLTWNFRVDQTASPSSSANQAKSNGVLFIVLLLISIIAISTVIYVNMTSKHMKTKGSKKHPEKTDIDNTY